MLQDIMDQWNYKDNFEYCFSYYCNYLDREGKWNLCENNVARNNFKYRMRRVDKGEIEPTKEWKKFEVWVEKRRVQEQKEVERRAIKLGNDWEKKYNKLKEETDKEIQSLKEQIKNEYNLRMELMNKYDSDSE